jgi:hypothetical protein
MILIDSRAGIQPDLEFFRWQFRWRVQSVTFSVVLPPTYGRQRRLPLTDSVTGSFFELNGGFEEAS